jgi:putative membrane protein
MSLLHRIRDPADGPFTAAALQMRTGQDPDAAAVSQPSAGQASRTVRRSPRSRIGTAWLGVCVAVLTLLVLVVFLLQNTQSVEVSFLWMEGSTPLAVALLVAVVCVAVLAILVGAARITQLRHRLRLSRKDRG